MQKKFNWGTEVLISIKQTVSERPQFKNSDLVEKAEKAIIALIAQSWAKLEMLLLFDIEKNYHLIGLVNLFI